MLQKLGSGERESMKKNSPSEQLEMTLESVKYHSACVALDIPF